MFRTSITFITMFYFCKIYIIIFIYCTYIKKSVFAFIIFKTLFYPNILSILMYCG